jgi:predicted transcriptional regulator
VRKINLNDFRVATSETARDINRHIVLNLIRKHQPVSRADLSRHSGLQRSTVSAIAGELISQRWVTEGAVSDLPRGRKPTFLHLNSQCAGIRGYENASARSTMTPFNSGHSPMQRRK